MKFIKNITIINLNLIFLKDIKIKISPIKLIDGGTDILLQHKRNQNTPPKAKHAYFPLFIIILRELFIS